jgi:hypothetical protein
MASAIITLPDGTQIPRSCAGANPNSIHNCLGLLYRNINMLLASSNFDRNVAYQLAEVLENYDMYRVCHYFQHADNVTITKWVNLVYDNTQKHYKQIDEMYATRQQS